MREEMIGLPSSPAYSKSYPLSRVLVGEGREGYASRRVGARRGLQTSTFNIQR